MITINDIIRQYDPDAEKEIKEVRRIGKLICERLNTVQCLQWTVFPTEFANCRTDSDLYQMIDNFNGWLDETGMTAKEEPKAKKEERDGAE